MNGTARRNEQKRTFNTVSSRNSSNLRKEMLFLNHESPCTRSYLKHACVVGSDGHTCTYVVLTKLGDTILQDPVGALLGHVPLKRLMFELQVVGSVGCVLASIMGPNVAGYLSDLSSLWLGRSTMVLSLVNSLTSRNSKRKSPEV